MKVREKGKSGNQGKKKQEMRKLSVVSGWLLSVAVFVAGGFIVLSTSGKYNLEKQTMSYTAQEKDAVLSAMAAPSEMDVSGEIDFQQEGELLQEIPLLQGEGLLQEEGVLEDGGIWQAKQERDIYRYKDGILTFLLIGVKGDGAGALGGNTDSFQTQALSLIVLDPDEKAVKLIPIKWNTMAAVDVYDEQGMHVGTVTAQVGVQHGFGGDGRASCEYQVKAVEKLFYGIPISGYLAADMDAVSDMAALVEEMDMAAAEEVFPEDTMEGQEYLLTEFVSKGMRLLKEEPASVIKIYHEMSGRMITDLTADEVSYLATIAGGYHFDAEKVITIPGINASGEEDTEGGYDEFYVDRKAFYRLVLETFFEPAD